MRFLGHISVMVLAVLASGCATQKAASGLSDRHDRQQTELFFEASKEKMLGNFEQAAVLFHECIKIDPGNDAAYYELGNILTEKEQLEDALPFALRAMKLDPDNVWYALFAADIQTGLDDFEAASRIYERLAEKHPDKIEYTYNLAMTYLHTNKFEKAIKAYDRIEQKVGVSEDISVQKEKIYLQMNRLTDAVNELDTLIANFPHEQRYLGMLAEVYTANDMADSAFSVYQRMLKNDPNDPMLHLDLAEYYKKKGENDISYSELKQAFGSPDLNIDAKIQVMMSYYSLTVRDERLLTQAYELIDLMTEAHPEDAKAFAMKADFLFRDGRMREAREAFYETVSLDSSRFAIWSQLINTSYQLRDFKAMEKDSRSALELFPNQGSLYLLNGIANNSLKQYLPATRILREGEPMVRSDTYLNAQLQSVLGDAFNSLKEFPSSDSAFNKALDLDPNNALILNNYSYFLSLRNEQLEHAEEMSKKSNLLQPHQASYQDTYGWILYQQGKFAEAITWLLKAMDNGGDQSGVIVEHYADALYRTGKTSEAMANWKKAIELPDHSDELQMKIDGKMVP